LVDAEPVEAPELTWLEVDVVVLAVPVDKALVEVDAVAEEPGLVVAVAGTVVVAEPGVQLGGVELPAEAVVLVEAFADPVVELELPVAADEFVEPLAVPEAGEVAPVDAVVLVEVFAVPDPLEDAVVEVEVEAFAEPVPVVAGVDGVDAAVVGVVEVEVEGHAGVVEDVVVAGVVDPDVEVV
jgi:hypothetical protein